MSALPFAIPDHVVDWIRDIFEQVNQRSASTLSRIPTTWETTLDHSLIGHLAEFSAPFRFASNWVVNLDTHFLGGGRYWGKWEIADIGLLIVFRRSGHVIGTKLALLQSKRLYPEEVDVEHDIHSIDYLVGFGRLLESDSEYRSVVKPRTFHFSERSKYQALEYGGEQYKAVLEYTVKHGVPVHYQLYNPLTVPSTADLPAAVEAGAPLPELRVGCRVVNAAMLDVVLQRAGLSSAERPSFFQIAGSPDRLDDHFWTLHNFVADLVLGCKEGYLAGTSPMNDEALFTVFNRGAAQSPLPSRSASTLQARRGVSNLPILSDPLLARHRYVFYKFQP